MSARAARLLRYRAARQQVAPRTSLRAFEALVSDVLDELPAFIQQRLENVAVLVDDGSRTQLEPLQPPNDDPDEELLGLYEGVNRLERAGGYHLAVPDRITLFWRPIVDEVGRGDARALRREVRKTVIHEIAHHFGIDDAELERLGG